LEEVIIMTKTVTGIFTDRDHANMALEELAKMGYTETDVSVITADEKLDADMLKEDSTAGGDVAESVTKGGLIGGVLGLIAGIGALTIPGIGALFIAGPVAAALGITGAAATTVSGALTGALAGGLIGALTEIGFNEAEAKDLEERIKKGAYLLMVHTGNENEAEVKEIFSRHQAEEIETRDLRI
jgi:uncharacterized membrane protein